MTKKFPEFESADPESHMDFDVPVWPREVDYRRRNTPSQNAHVFLDARPDKLIFSDGEFYTLGFGGIWQRVERDDLRQEMRETDPGISIASGAMRVMLDEMTITNKVRTSVRPFQWLNEPDDAPTTGNLVLSASGIVDAMTGKTTGLNGDYFATAVPVWNFDPAARCPLWLAKLKEWLHPDFHPTLQEFVGYTMTPDTAYHFMLALIGETRGGKGTITRIMEALVGETHSAFPSFDDFSGPFGLEGFNDKRLIILPDAQDGSKNKGRVIERLKSISASDPVAINKKGIKQELRVQLAAKLVLVANRHPRLLDESSALAERELPIMFDKSFAKVADPDLTKKLKTELPGIANWAIEGLRRLRDNNGRFTEIGRAKKAKKALREEQSTALRFTKECLEVTGDKTDLLPLTLAFRAYEHWAYFTESLDRKLRRDKTAFKEDMLVALRKLGVGYAENMVRWHDPELPKQRNGERIERRFLGLKIKRASHPDAKENDASA